MMHREQEHLDKGECYGYRYSMQRKIGRKYEELSIEDIENTKVLNEIGQLVPLSDIKRETLPYLTFITYLEKET